MTHRQNVSFRTSAHTGVGISIEFRAAHRHTGRSFAPFSGIHPRKIVLLFGRLPRQCALLYRNDMEFGFAMTGNSINSQFTVPQNETERVREKTKTRISHTDCPPALPARAGQGKTITRILRTTYPPALPAKKRAAFAALFYGRNYMSKGSMLSTGWPTSLR